MPESQNDRFDVLQRLEDIRNARGLSVYKLAKISGIPQSTIATWYQKNLYPPVDKIEQICRSLDISLADFFNCDDKVYIASRQDILHLQKWHMLTMEEQNVITSVMDMALTLSKYRET